MIMVVWTHIVSSGGFWRVTKSVMWRRRLIGIVCWVVRWDRRLCHVRRGLVGVVGEAGRVDGRRREFVVLRKVRAA
jgi:hypothetical protein